MVKIIKGEEPNSLVRNAEKWTDELLTKYAENNNDPSKVETKYWNKYRNDDVKDSLKEECFDKCMYCDTILGAANYGHIEHIKPKKKNPSLTYEWRNLGWCCERCNIKKGEEEVLNPYEIDLEDKVTVTYAFMLTGRCDTDYETQFFIAQLDLNGRAELAGRRCQECYNFEVKLKNMKIMYENGDSNINLYLKVIKSDFKYDKEYYIFKKSIFKKFIEANNIQLEGISI